MKNMKNYEAPKAEVIELDVNNDFMFGPSGGGSGSGGSMSQTSTIFS
jgi:hypothetical protein